METHVDQCSVLPDPVMDQAERQTLTTKFRLALLLLLSLTLLSTGCDEGDPAPVTVVPARRHSVSARLKSGVDWLLKQQASDGGWHSETYGNMRCGAGITALVLAALAEVPTGLDSRVQPAFERGVAFLATNLDQQGLVRAPDGSVDYPIYATALVILAIEKRTHLKAEPIKSRMCRGLLASQRNAANGWPEDSPDFGGWGILGGEDRPPTSSLPSNISVTTHVLLALAKTKTLTLQARTDALSFLARCQVLNTGLPDDGGFAFTGHPDDPLNKAGILQLAQGRTKGRPYRTATYDGAVSLLACGLPITDDRVAAGLSWLRRDNSSTNIRSAGNDSGWSTARDGLEYYELAAVAQLCKLTANQRLGGSQKQQLEALMSLQRNDGSWSNPHTSMREDDPLIATAAMISVLGQEHSME